MVTKKANKAILLNLLVVAIIIMSKTLLWSYQWPVSPFVGAHPINGTLGEWRETHLHAGVDIGRGTGTEVYPSVDGLIPNPLGAADTYQNRHFIKVLKKKEAGNFEYIHIVPDTTLLNELRSQEGQDYQVTAGVTLLGTVDDQNHLHFEENDGALNPLRVGGLDNYTDTARTYVSTLEFFRQGTEMHRYNW